MTCVSRFPGGTPLARRWRRASRRKAYQKSARGVNHRVRTSQQVSMHYRRPLALARRLPHDDFLHVLCIRVQITTSGQATKVRMKQPPLQRTPRSQSNARCDRPRTTFPACSSTLSGSSHPRQPDLHEFVLPTPPPALVRATLAAKARIYVSATRAAHSEPPFVIRASGRLLCAL